MQRVQTLSNVLAEKIQKNASIAELLNTVKMLESELIHLKSITPPTDATINTAAIHIAKKIVEEQIVNEALPIIEPEKTVEVLQVDEAEMEAELAEIKKNAVEINNIVQQNKQPILFAAVDDIPTMQQRHTNVDIPIASSDLPISIAVENLQNIANNILPKEINESQPANNATSLNEKLATLQNEISDTFSDAAIKDLKKAIGVNERFLYLNELFRGDETMYERSIKTINAFEIYPEAEYWIRRELKLKLGWDDNYQTVKQFDQLIKRRFA